MLGYSIAEQITIVRALPTGYDTTHIIRITHT